MLPEKPYLIKRNKRTKRVTVTISEKLYNQLVANYNKFVKDQEYTEWFKKNYKKVHWTDEYGESHYKWKDVNTGEVLQQNSCRIPFLM